MSTLSQHQQLPLKEDTKNKQLEANNKRAYELLMRIQSQVEASTVIATSSKRESSYE